jgi:peptide chain release factor 1
MNLEMQRKLADIEARSRELEQQLASPEVHANRQRLRELSKARARLEPVIAASAELRRIEADAEQAGSLLAEEADEELAEELNGLEARRAELEQRLAELLAPRDPDADRDVIMEIRAGAGGEEAALFAGDLFRMYSRYGEKAGWKTELLSASPADLGGYKEIIFSVQGASVYGLLRRESGVHRVQRVPVTEASGRIHTSTATVAVLLEVEEVEVEIGPADLEIETYRASGPGGQHMQKNETAVRVRHKLTGMVVACQDERSQHQNREKAMRMLRARLYELAKAQQQSEIADARRSQVGTGERSEKIRTYNFPQNRVTDHRLGRSWHNLSQILDGEVEPLLKALEEKDKFDRTSEAAGKQ